MRDVLHSLLDRLKIELIKDFVYALHARITGKNSCLTPARVIVDQMTEPRALPLGRTEFEEWSNRIISGSILQADPDSQKFALCNMLLHLGPTESHKPDAFFIHSLRKFAINQVADDMRKELHEKVKARTAAEEAK
jgi:hypothetical protein